MSSDPALVLARWFSTETFLEPVNDELMARLKWTIDTGEIDTADDLALWIEAILSDGFGYHDSLYMSSANEARSDQELEALNLLCEAYYADSGRASDLDWLRTDFERILEANHGISLGRYAYPVAIGKAAAICGLPLDMTTRFYLRSLAMRLIRSATHLMQLSNEEARAIMMRVLTFCSALSKRTLNPINRNFAPTLFETS